MPVTAVPPRLTEALENALGRAGEEVVNRPDIKAQAESISVSEQDILSEIRANQSAFLASAPETLSKLSSLYKLFDKLIQDSDKESRWRGGRRTSSTTTEQRAVASLETSGWEELSSRIAQEIVRLTSVLAEQAVVPHIRLWLNQKREEKEARAWKYKRSLNDDVDLSDLRKPVSDRSFIVTEPLQYLGRLMQRMPGGSIGVSGPRGSGKSTAIEHIERVLASLSPTDNSSPPLDVLHVSVPAPVEYVPRDFLLHLHDEICAAWIAHEGSGSLAEQINTTRARRVWNLFTAVAPILLLVTTISLVWQYVAGESLSEPGRTLPLVAVLLSVPLVGLYALFITDTVNVCTDYVYTKGGGAISTGDQMTSPTFYKRFALNGVVLTISYSLLLVLLIIGPAWLDARRAAGIALVLPFPLIVTALPFLHRQLRFVDTIANGRRSELLIIACVQALLFSLAVHGLLTALLTVEYYAPTAEIVIAGACLAAATMLFTFRRSPAPNLKSATGRPQSSVDHAIADRRRIRYQRTEAAGWTAGAKLGATGILPIGLESASSRTVTEAEHAMSPPEIIRMTRDFLERIGGESRSEPATRMRIVICIDELDKLEGVDGAKPFLNEIKGVLGIPCATFLVSVSEDAMASFERRGLAFRDVFDSAFDEIVHIPQLSLQETSELIGKRVRNPPRPFVALAHCLSAGLARDVIRVLDHMADTPEPMILTHVAETVIHRELRGKWQAVVAAVRAIPLEPQVTDVIKVLYPIDQCPGLRIDPDRCLVRPDAFKDISTLTLSRPEGAELEHFRTLSRLGAEYLGFTYYCLTLLKFFDLPTDAELHKFIAAEEADRLQPMSLAFLARSRQHLGVNPHLAWEGISAFRDAHGLKVIDFPSALHGR